MGSETMATPPSEAVAAPMGKARWTRLALIGLLMEAAAPLLFLVAIFAFGLKVSSDLLVFVVALVVPAIGALLVWRFGSWAKFVGILTALIGAAALFWTAFSITFISSFFDFMPAVLLIPGFLIALVSLIASLVAGRRGHRTPAATGGEKIALRAVMGIVLLLALVSGILTLVGRSSTQAASASETLGMKNSVFERTSLQLQGGQTIVWRDEDPFAHTFTIDALNIDEAFTPGDEIAVTIPNKPGTYIFYCKYHTSDPKHPTKGDMAGTITIR